MLTDIALLLLRLTVGLLFVGHGAQKLFGWFGGPGLNGAATMMERMGMRPARFWAWINALAEFGGGLLLTLGFLTPLAAAALVSVMVMAIIKVHGHNGLWNANRGYEFNLLLIAGALAIGLAGPGSLALGPALIPAGTRLALLLAGLVAGLLGDGLALLTAGRHGRQGQPGN
jgi:putative oxidoreductase